MKRAARATPTAEPCEHKDAWVPEAMTFGGVVLETYFDIVCMSCGWQGQVPLSQMPDGES